MQRELTGRHVLTIVLLAFGTIIAVNLFMAFQAVGTFPGLEVKNSYVASQSFERDRASQKALGWQVEPTYDGQDLTIVIRDAEGRPAPVETLAVTVGRPTHVRDDVSPQFSYVGGVFRAPLHLGPGAWIIHLSATSVDGTAFRQRIDHYTGNRVN